MIELLMVANNKLPFNAFSETLEKAGASISWASSGSEALGMVKEKQYSLLLTAESLPDMSGIELAKQTVMINPMINLAITSALIHKAFHEATEGLGVLCQVPLTPSEKDALTLMSRLKEVLGINE